MNWRVVIVIITCIFLLAVSALVIFFARGYQIDLTDGKVTPTGILVATSDPDGAEVFINGKLTTATNNTINLPPGKYSVKIAKEGFNTWEKVYEIKTEEVEKTNAFLFPSLPELRPLTLTGAKNPIISPDETKIAYTIASSSAVKNGLWVLDMNRSFPFGSADFRQIGKIVYDKFTWASDGKDLVATTSAKTTHLLPSDRLNEFPQPILALPPETLKVNPVVPIFLASRSANVQFSPDQTKILYLATISATLPMVLTSYLPGKNPALENRSLQPGNLYVYDIKEDKNYLITACPSCRWFPSSRHLLANDTQKILIMDFDGTNAATIYSGPFDPKVVFPWPNWSKIVILTSLNGLTNNLYTINLR